MRVSLPAHRGHDLDGHGWNAIWEDAESVLLGLEVEDLEARDGDDLGANVVLLLQERDSVNADADLGSGGNEDNVGLLLIVHDVTTLDGGLDGGVLELRKVLAGEGDDGWGVLGGEGNVVCSAGLVSVSWAPDHAVWQSTEVCEGLDGLMGWSILTKSDGVVGSDPDDADLGESGETDGAGSVGDEVQEGSRVWDEGSVCGEAVHDGTHGVLTDTISDVTSAPVTEASRWWLEVNSILPPGQVGAGQICRSSDQLWDDRVDLGEDNLGQLSRRNRLVLWGVDRKALLPSLWQLAGETTLEVGSLGAVLYGVFLQELVPLCLESCTLGALLVVQIVNSLWDGEGLLWVEAELLLDLDDIILLEWCTVNTTGSRELGAESNGRAELDHRWLILDSLALLDSRLDRVQVVVSIANGLNVPSVCLHSLVDILGERTVDVTINGNMVVVVNGDQVAQLQMTGKGSGLAGNTLHVASITHENIGVVVDDLKSWSVELGRLVVLSNGQTDCIGETLAKRTSCDLDTWSVVSFRVTWGDAVDVSEVLEVRHRESIAGKMENGILEHACMAVRKDESIAVDPFWVLWVVVHDPVEENVGHWGHSHGSARMARVCVEGRIDLEKCILSVFCSLFFVLCSPLILAIGRSSWEFCTGGWLSC